MTDDYFDINATSAPWVVVGSSGFVGKGIFDEAKRRGIEVKQVIAPRLCAPTSISAVELGELVSESEHLNSLISQFTNASVVINAAGMATPDNPASDALTGANAGLPALIVLAATMAGVSRVVHLSSAAVQGNRRVLDESVVTAPFSPYSQSKALGEAAALAVAKKYPSTDVVIVRATSVQGPQRPTTRALSRIATGPLASVASPGSQPSVVSSLEGLADFVVEMASCKNLPNPVILIQPWEGATVSSVLELAGGRSPTVLPAWLCRSMIGVGYALGHLIPRMIAISRRLEVMWFGQKQVEGFAVQEGLYKRETEVRRPRASLIRALSSDAVRRTG